MMHLDFSLDCLALGIEKVIIKLLTRSSAITPKIKIELNPLSTQDLRDSSNLLTPNLLELKGFILQ